MTNRIEKVLAILTEKGYRSVSELAADLSVSEMTIRRYLGVLEERGAAKRTHGGAYTGQEMMEVDYRIRETVRQKEKESIGRMAFSLIESGESVYIDAGSTAAYLAYSFDDSKRITVVTNSVIVAAALEQKTNVATILLGGKVHGPSHSSVGPLALENVNQFRFTKAFLGASAISLSAGLTQSLIDEVSIKKRVADLAKEVIVLADSSKINKEVLVVFLPLEKVDAIITDGGISANDRKSFEEAGVRIIVCP